MATNSQIILDGVLKQRQLEIDPESNPASFFEFFTAQQVLKDFDLSYDEIESGLVGDGGDGGIDGIYLLVNGDLVREDSDYDNLKKDITIDLIIVQSKTNPGFQETPIERFITVSNDLFDLSKDSSLSGIYNDRLVESIESFHNIYKHLAPWFPTLKVTFFYVSKGENPSNSVKRKVEMLRNVVAALIPKAKIVFHFAGATELLDLAARQPHTTFSLPLAESPISSEDQVGFVCLVKLRDFFKFITDEQDSLQRQLFEANVRDYQGHNQVNDEIQESLQNTSAEDFWWLNNGVSILATEASLGGKTLTIKNPQIVNGLQTSTEVHKYCKDIGGAKLESEWRTMLIRVMVPTEDDSRDRIIKATNRQTVVPLASLKATHKIHRLIEEHLKHKGLFYDRRKNYYKNQGKPRRQIVGIPYMAQAVMAIVLQQPNQARARPSSLLKNERDYGWVFNLAYPIELYYICADVMRRVEAWLKSPNVKVVPADRNNLRFYVAMHAVAVACNSQTPSPGQIANVDLDTIDESMMSKSLNIVHPTYVALGGNDQVSKGPCLLESILCDTNFA